MSGRPLTLSPADIEQVYDAERAVASQELAFLALGNGSAIQAPRVLIDGIEDSVAFCYTNRLSADGPAVTKFGSVNPVNPSRGIPSIAAVMVVLDPTTGQVEALMDGVSVTTLRTSAASAVAARTLAVSPVHNIGIVGSGVQARAHALLLAHVFSELQTLRLWSPATEQVDELAAELSKTLPAIEVIVCDDARSLVERSTTVALCTTSLAPVIEDSWVRPGTTVISIGSFAPDRHEVPASLLSRAHVVVDDRDAALADAGPVIAAVDEGMLDPAAITTLGEILTGRSAGRRTEDEIVYYNSVGLGVQDAAAAAAILAGATEHGLGQKLDW